MQKCISFSNLIGNIALAVIIVQKTFIYQHLHILFYESIPAIIIDNVDNQEFTVVRNYAKKLQNTD